MVVDYDTTQMYFSYGNWAIYAGNYTGHPKRCIKLQVWCPRDTGFNPGGKNGWYSYSFMKEFKIDMVDKTITTYYADTITNLRGKKVGPNRYSVYDKLKRSLKKCAECPFWWDLIQKYYNQYETLPLTEDEYQGLTTNPHIALPT